MRKKFPFNKLKLLEQKYSKYWWSPEEEEVYKKAVSNPFTNIVFTILSQNTSSKNTMRAYISLSKRIKITPENLSKLKEENVAEAIKPGGLHRIKAKRLINLAKTIIKEWKGDMSWVYRTPKNELRKYLVEINGIGDKTADVLLSSIYGKREAFVVDTHMRRIAIRLGLVTKNAKYGEIQDALTRFLPWKGMDNEERLAGLFWMLARNTCTARNPKCYECILSEICEYPHKNT